MDAAKIIQVKKSVYADNNQKAEEIRQDLIKKGIFALNVMSSPGSGKTSTLVQVLQRMKDHWKIAVIEADVDSSVDAETILQNGVEAIQLHTGGMCHMDASMMEQGLAALSADDYDMILVENIGNLICTAGFDIGAHRSINILSVPEGDDKPLKYPKMFEECDLIVVNKIDVLDYFDFDLARFKDNVLKRNKNAEIIAISARTGEGVDLLVEWLEEQIRELKK